jgi:hypothetical protein
MGFSTKKDKENGSTSRTFYTPIKQADLQQKNQMMQFA